MIFNLHSQGLQCALSVNDSNYSSKTPPDTFGILQPFKGYKLVCGTPGLNSALARNFSPIGPVLPEMWPNMWKKSQKKRVEEKVLKITNN